MRLVLPVCGSSKCLRALHRRTLRDAALRRQREDVSGGPTEEAHRRISPSSDGKRGRDLCAGDVEMHSFEVWVPLSCIDDIRLLPLKSPVRVEAQHLSQTTEEASAAVAELLASLGSSPRIGVASSEYRDLCLVAGEVGVSVGRVYTSLTAFTDADSAGTAQLVATRLLLRKAGEACS